MLITTGPVVVIVGMEPYPQFQFEGSSKQNRQGILL